MAKLQRVGILLVAVLTYATLGECTLSFSLLGYTNIPTDGRGRILITDIGDTDEQALICSTDLENPGRTTNWYLHPNNQSTSQRIVFSVDRRGWRITRDTGNGIIRLRRYASYTVWTEGVFTCTYPPDLPIYVGIYHPISVSISIIMLSPRESTFTVNCTTIGGTVLTGSLSGPGGVSIAFQPVGTRRYKGQDSYRASTGTRTGGKDGDTYQCTASNGIPSPDGSIGTSIRVASPPAMVSAQQVAPGSSISVTWMSPSGGAPVTGYLVHYSGGGDAGSVDVGPSATSVIIVDRISDGRTYNITVEARSRHLSGESTIVKITLIPAPSPPTGFRVTNIQPHSVDLSWDVQFGVERYIIHYSQVQGPSQMGACNGTHSGSFSTINDSTRITVRGSGDDMLRAFTTYSITVTAVRVTIGSSAPSVPVHVTTAQTGATTPPTNVRVVTESSRHISVEWDPIEHCKDWNGNIVRYRVRYQASGGSVETKVVSGVASAGGYIILLDGLTPSTDYFIQVAAVNEQSDVGVFSEVVSAKTFAGRPGPVNISAIPDFFQITFNWMPPRGVRNIISIYEVTYWPSAQPLEVKKENTTNLVHRLTVTGLEPGTDVTFAVIAYARREIGEKVTVTVSTLTRPPPVQGVSVTRLSASSVQVSWEAFMTEVDVSGYTVIYSKVSGSKKRKDGEMRRDFPAIATSAVIDELESEATYMFQVLATAMVAGEKVAGDRSLVTEDNLLIPRDDACNCECSTDSVPIIVSTLIAFIGVTVGVIIAVGTFLMMRNRKEVKMAKNQAYNVEHAITFSNLVNKTSSVKITTTEEAGMSPDLQQPEPVYEHLDTD